MADKSLELTDRFLDLARDMALNHVYLSVPNEDYPIALEYLLKPKIGAGRRKIVAVVGAGASNDACNLPIGGEAAKHLIETFKSKANVSERLIQEEVHRITVEYRLRRGDFEATLLALSKFDQKTVLEKLNAMYSRRHYPSSAYEVLAHWLKHRFIDAIVNFNFDEILDQAIDDELGYSGCYRVITDGDCPESVDRWVDKRDRFKFPLYIKPHGTASHKTTMRFTRSSYSLLPPDIENLLTTLFSGAVDVLIIGHAMQSVEFNDILARSGGSLSFYAISHSKPAFGIGNGRKMCDVAFLNSRSAGGLGPCIASITSASADAFKVGFEPRSICRHRLIADLFRRRVDLDEEKYKRERENEDYLRDRVYVEIALAVSKAKGVVGLEYLSHSRAGRYFRLLRQYARAGASKDSMLSMCTDLNLTQFNGYSRDTLCLPVSAEHAQRDRLRYPILPKSEFKDVARQLAKTVTNHMSPARQTALEESGQLYEAFMEMYDGDEVEVSNDTRMTASDAFVDPTTLPTLTSLRAQTMKMIRSSNWDSIVCTAESGQWLLRPEWSDEIRKRKGLALVLADMTYSDRLRDCFGELLSTRIRWLPWWLHNRHVTVLLKEGKAVQAIFFERRLRTSHIAPLRLEGPDAEIAMDAFVAYWIKARQLDDLKEVEIRPEKVLSEREKLIDDIGGRLGRVTPWLVASK
ncbi:MAG TPA: SIR2 family protein [Candidatus Dormibacteraeota bacterium]|nr:SIR2 family protein [Candidatus Dormibacteraeota bacterium]